MTVEDLSLEAAPSRYVVGIDLGTTNSALCYVDTTEQPWSVRTLPIPQLVAPGQVEARETLPSFHYEPAAGEMPPDSRRLPWSTGDEPHFVGVLARDQGTQAPGRLIASAKSWLCHSGVDRTAELLPWHAAPDVERLSPVAASTRYLAHLHAAWNHRFPAEPLSRQDVVLTLPASFDEVARELTVAAAAEAGLSRVVLIEEPQAAFYAWIDAHADRWERLVSPGQKILICDIGGGTTDFTLIRVRRSESAGEPIQFHRVAVGEHLILGGDNLDLALAQHIERRLHEKGQGETRLEPRAWDVLVRVCRSVKEHLLGAGGPERWTIHLPGSGSRLIGGGRQIEVTRDEVRAVLVDGFFPFVPLDDKPAVRRSGFQEFGLPYAADPATTRYLAAFLTAHRNVALEDVPESATHDPARPDLVLFNGGVFESAELRQRLLDVLTSWFRGTAAPGKDGWSPVVLENQRLDLAVARGAAYYGMVRRGSGVRIAAGLARTYYIGVASDPPSAVCLVPGSAQPGQDIDLTARTFTALVSQPAEFPLYVSSTRLADRPGELLPIDREQMKPLPPIRTVLRTRRRGDRGTVAVQLHARLTEIGTVELWCTEVDGPGSWRLQFDVRSATQTDVAARSTTGERHGVFDESTWQRCQDCLDRTFGPQATEKPETLMKRLAEALESERQTWPPTLLRRLWDALLQLEAGRRKSPVYEARWLNLLGYALRPGYGLAVDDWRVAETWRQVQGKLVHGAPACRTESLILWRRIGGGLSAGQQRAVADPLLATVRSMARRFAGQSRAGDATFSPHEATEVWRLLGSLELLPLSLKLELGDLLLELIPHRKLEAVRPGLVWALGRIGAREPAYGPLNTVVTSDVAARWLRVLLDSPAPDAATHLAAMQLARKTDDRYRDLPEKLRGETIAWFTSHSAPEHYALLLRERATLDDAEQDRIFGESLPTGLRLQTAVETGLLT